MIQIIHMFETIISLLMAIVGATGATTNGIINYCSSCGEPWNINQMIVCHDCGSYICPICNDSYHYVLGDDASGCFSCNYDAPAGSLPEDYDYSQWD